MKVNIGVVGRFHAFDLAKQLQKYKLLNKLITTYPKFKVKEWEIESDKIVSEIFLEILRRYGNRISYISKENINKFISIKHAKYAISYLNQCDIYIGWSGSSLETLIEAKKRGVTTILERGSTHYTYQQNILFEEFNKYGLKFNINYDIWARELLEYELCDYISIPSSFVKRTFMEKGIPENKLLVNPYGVDLSNFKQIPKEDDIFRIIFAGGGSLRKGYHYLLQAFYELDLPNCELWHLGSVNDEMRPYIEKYKHKNWILKGHKPQNELYKYYSQGSVFILPSLEDGFSMVQFQAMACGLPLVCTTNTGGEDLISKDGEEGFVIPIRDVEAIKEKILYLYENQNICKEMGKKAKKRVSNGFTWEDYGNRYIKNIDRISRSDKNK
jgi:glycosyltransferase involved in cell wall biosynthesis